VVSALIHSFFCVLSNVYCCFISACSLSNLPFRLSLLCHCTRKLSTSPVFTNSEAAAMVFITSDLFGAVSTHNQHHRQWHIMTEAPHDVESLGKRKRTQDGDGRAHRSHHATPFDYDHDSEQLYTTAEHRPMKQLKRISPKLSLLKSTSHLMDTDAGAAPPVHFKHGQVQPHAVADLRACHACKTAPKRKSDLENYMDCKRCVGRTCYICARQCLGGCGKKVCRECTAEVGKERDSWCLDCLQRDQYMK
jgi:hypothetical protein